MTEESRQKKRHYSTGDIDDVDGAPQRKKQKIGPQHSSFSSHDIAKKKQSSEEMNFPRGGGSLKPQPSTRKPKPKKDKDSLFDVQENNTNIAKKPKKKKKRLNEKEKGPNEKKKGSNEKKKRPNEKKKSLNERKKNPNEKEKKPNGKEKNAKSGKEPKNNSEQNAAVTKAHHIPEKVELLQLSTLREGMLLLGSVKEVNELDVVVSLPNNLKGTISITEVSDVLNSVLQKELADSDTEDRTPSLEEFFEVGQILCCSVMKRTHSLRSAKHVDLTIRESVLNSKLTMATVKTGMIVTGAVKSVEDHGYIVSFGTSSFTGFIQKDNAKSRRTTKTESKRPKAEESVSVVFKVGQPIQGIVTKINVDINTVFLDTDPTKLARKITKGPEIANINALRPGMLVTATVRKILNNGLWVTFLNYFAGTIDLFHLDKIYDYDVLDKHFAIGQKIKARILYVDFENKAVGLTVKPNLLSLEPYHFNVTVGDIFENAVVKRVDRGIGLAIELPTKEPQAGYVHISRISDKKIKMEKKYKVGDGVKCRVVSLSHIDGLANATMKYSEINAPFVRYEDIKVGEKINGIVLAIHPKGIEVKIANSSLRAFCPRSHVADTNIKDFTAHFKIGGNFPCRVLATYPNRKRIVVTHKKTLLHSELPLITSYENAKPEMLSHGVILHVQDFGCIVGFYNDVKGLVPSKELTTGYIQRPSDAFKPGQVHICRVLECDPEKQKLVLSFITKKKEEAEEELAKWREAFNKLPLGEFISVTVSKISTKGLEVKINDHLMGFIPTLHLSDHITLCELLLKKFKVGDVIDNALVLRKKETTRQIILSLKPSLKEARRRQQLPATLQDIKKNTHCSGYVRRITDFGIFVGFLGDLNGLAWRNNLADVFVTDINAFFTVGQSVTAYIFDVNSESGQFTVSLKPSLCDNQNIEFLQSFFEEQKQLTKKKVENILDKYRVGAIVKGTIAEIHSYATFLHIGSDKLKGLAITKQTKNENLEIGTEVDCIILDIDLSTGILDVSLRPEFIAELKENQQAEVLHEGMEVSGRIELVKQHYLVLTLEKKYGRHFAYAPTRVLNNQKYVDPFTLYSPLQQVVVTICKLPSEYDSRLLVSIKGNDTRQLPSNSSESRVPSLSDIYVGMPVKCTIQSIYKNYMTVSIGSHVKGRIHITEVSDEVSDTHPFESFRVNQVIENARVVRITERVSNKYSLPISHKHPITVKTIDLSIRPSILAPWTDKPPLLPTWETLQKGQILNCWVHQVTPDCLWVHVSPTVRGRVFILDVSDDVEILSNIKEHFRPGKGVKCKVMRVDIEKQDLDLSIKAVEDNPKKAYTPDKLAEGMIVPGRIARVVLNQAVYVQLFGHTYGRAFITDLFDDYIEDPIGEYAKKEGQIVRCYILGTNRTNNEIDVSLRPSRVYPDTVKQPLKYPEIKSLEDVSPGLVVQGYVKNIHHNTLFVALNRNLTARVLFKNLSTKFVKNPAKKYPIGKLVTGRIIAVDDDKIEMSLKKTDVQQHRLSFDELKIGMTVKGWVKRIDPKFGVFVSLKDCNIVGLCHLTEVNDTFVKPEELKSTFSVGDYVRAVIIRKNPDKKQISLSMKPSHFKDVPDNDEKETNTTSDESEDNEESDNDNNLELATEKKSSETQQRKDEISNDNKIDNDDEQNNTNNTSDSDEVNSVENEEEVQSTLDNFENMSVENETTEEEMTEKENNTAEVQQPTEQAKLEPPATTKTLPIESISVGFDFSEYGFNPQHEPRTEHNSDIAQALSEKDEKRSEFDVSGIFEENESNTAEGPKTAEDYERLIFTEPNNSLTWIKYMAFWISVAEIQKARETAEKALQRISQQHHRDRLNIWIAYMNLENKYGTKETLAEIFRRAQAYHDPKVVHFELINICLRSNNIEMAEDLYIALTKKYKDSKKVWIRYGMFKFRQNQPEAARALLERAIQCIPKRKHIALITKFAQMEFKFGSPERGRTIFETLLATYPKRVDLWNVYLDLEISQKNVDKVRALFERVTDSNFSSKKMKFLFKKWLQFEKNFGNPNTETHVKNKASTYVEKKLKGN